MDTGQLLINFLLFLYLPLWAIAGLADWFCHRATHIESTTGIKESLMHCVMGIQTAIPMVLCLTFRVNVLILILCLLAWLCHEIVAHWDVSYAEPRRRISIWEMHAHSYLATLPFFMLTMILIINWEVTLDLLTFNWAGGFELEPVSIPHGGEGYLVGYLSFLSLVCVFPYMEELWRCWRQRELEIQK